MRRHPPRSPGFFRPPKGGRRLPRRRLSPMRKVLAMIGVVLALIVLFYLFILIRAYS